MKKEQRYLCRHRYYLLICILLGMTALPGLLSAQSCSVNGGSNKRICFGSCATLSASATGGGTYSYSWQPAATLSNPTGATTNACPTVTTVYTVVATSSLGYTCSDQVVVYVKPYNNLALNGNFEDGPVPSGRGEIDNLPDWHTASGTPDVFDANFNGSQCPVLCGTSPADYNCVGIPCNHFGNRSHVTGPGISGNRYAGLWTALAPEGIVFTEGLYKDVNLTHGKQYRLTFYAARAPKGEPTVGTSLTNPIDPTLSPNVRFKVAMTNVLNTGSLPGAVSYSSAIPSSAQVIVSTGNVVSTNWTKYTYTFTANAANKQYLVIESYPGSGSVASNTVGNQIQGFNLVVEQSYMYLDEVKLEEICAADAPTADAGPDKTVCKGSCTTIGTAAVAGNTYFWSPNYALGSNTSAAPTACPSVTTTYTVIVTNAIGETATDEVVVTVSDPYIDAGQSFTVAGGNPICAGTSVNIGSNGSGGIAPYTYTWTPTTYITSTSSGMATVVPTVNSTAVVTLTYTLKITDAAGCTASDFTTIDVLPSPAVNAGADFEACKWAIFTLNGSATAGTTPYAYMWTASPASWIANQTSPSTQSQVASNTTFTLRVTGHNGCSATDNVVVTMNNLPVFAPTTYSHQICSGQGSVTIGSAASGGTGAITYSWSNVTASTPTVNVSPSSTTAYWETAIDSKGCRADQRIEVIVNPVPAANAGSTKTVCPNTPAILGGTHVASGGTPSYGYLWTPSGGLTPNNTTARPVANPTVTTVYTLKVTDSKGCTATDAVTVNVAPSCTGVGGGCGTGLTANAGDDDTLCANINAPIGGSPTATGSTGPYTYKWEPAAGYLNSSTAANPTIIAVFSQKTFWVTVTDNCGNTAKDVVTIKLSDPHIYAGDDRTICAGNNTTIGCWQPWGGYEPYTYAWSSSSGMSVPSSLCPTIAPVVTASYTVTMTDKVGCRISDQVVVTVDPAVVANAGPDQILCKAPGSKVTLGAPPVAGYTYLWDPPTGLSSHTVANPDANPLNTTRYRLTVTKGVCTSTDEVDVTVYPSRPYIDLPPVSPLCSGQSVTIGSTASGGTPGYTYSWSPAAGLNLTNVSHPLATPSVTTSYIVTVKDANLCEIKDTVVVTVIPSPSLSVSNASICSGLCTTIGAAATGGVTPYVYSWYPNTGVTAATASVCPTSTTTYTETVTGNNGCAVSAPIVVTVFSSPEHVQNGTFDGPLVPAFRGEISKATHWFAATGDPDLFDSQFTSCLILPNTNQVCDINPADVNCLGIPCNHFGSEGHRNASATSKRYAGLFAAAGIDRTVNGNPQQIKLLTEGIEVPLTPALDPSKTYQLSFWVSRAEKGEVDVNTNILVHDTADFVVKFSSGQVTNTLFQPTNVPLSFKGSAVKSLGWEFKSFVFTPSSSVDHLIIESDPQNTLKRLQNELTAALASDISSMSLNSTNSIADVQAYFYIDDISIREVCPYAPALTVSAGSNVTVSTGSTTSLTATASGGLPPYMAYKWSPSLWLSNDAIYNPTATAYATRTYTVKVTDSNGSTATSSVVVSTTSGSRFAKSAAENPEEYRAGAFSLSIYPNPFSESTVIEYNLGEKAGKAQIRIFDMIGKEIRTVNLSESGQGRLELSGEDLIPGVYFCHFYLNGEVVSKTKLVNVK
jgi:hypothetical protein